MARLISPDGTETIDVPDNMAEHYLAKGARYAPPEEEAIQEPLLSPVDALAGGGAIKAGAALGRAGLSAVGKIGGGAVRGGAQAVGRVASAPVIRRFPGMTNVRGMAKDLAELTGGKAAPKAAPRPDLKLVKGSAESRAAARAKPAKAPAKSTPKAPAKSSAKAPAKGSVESRKNWKPRGASRPELERRTTARAKAVGHEPAMGDDIGNQLKKSLEIEAMFEQYGLSQAERAVAREALRRGVLPQF